MALNNSKTKEVEVLETKSICLSRGVKVRKL